MKLELETLEKDVQESQRALDQMKTSARETSLDMVRSIFQTDARHTSRAMKTIKESFDKVDDASNLHRQLEMSLFFATQLYQISQLKEVMRQATPETKKLLIRKVKLTVNMVVSIAETLKIL